MTMVRRDLVVQSAEPSPVDSSVPGIANCAASEQAMKRQQCQHSVPQLLRQIIPTCRHRVGTAALVLCEIKPSFITPLLQRSRIDQALRLRTRYLHHDAPRRKTRSVILLYKQRREIRNYKCNKWILIPMQKRLAKIFNKMLTNNKHCWDRGNPQNYSTEEDLLRHRTMLSECCWDKTLPTTVTVCKTLLHELSSYSLAAAIFASYKRSPPVLAQIRIKSDVANFIWIILSCRHYCCGIAERLQQGCFWPFCQQNRSVIDVLWKHQHWNPRTRTRRQQISSLSPSRCRPFGNEARKYARCLTRAHIPYTASGRKVPSNLTSYGVGTY